MLDLWYNYKEVFLLKASSGLGERLRAARLRKGYSLADVEKITGWHFTTIAAYERGEKMPPAEKLRILAKLYDTTADYLLVGEDPPPLPSWAQNLPEDVRRKFLEVNPAILRGLFRILDKATAADLPVEALEALLDAHLQLIRRQRKDGKTKVGNDGGENSLEG